MATYWLLIDPLIDFWFVQFVSEDVDDVDDGDDSDDDDDGDDEARLVWTLTLCRLVKRLRIWFSDFKVKQTLTVISHTCSHQIIYLYDLNGYYNILFITGDYYKVQSVCI